MLRTNLLFKHKLISNLTIYNGSIYFLSTSANSSIKITNLYSVNPITKKHTAWFTSLNLTEYAVFKNHLLLASTKGIYLSNKTACTRLSKIETPSSNPNNIQFLSENQILYLSRTGGTRFPKSGQRLILFDLVTRVETCLSTKGEQVETYFISPTHQELVYQTSERDGAYLVRKRFYWLNMAKRQRVEIVGPSALINCFWTGHGHLVLTAADNSRMDCFRFGSCSIHPKNSTTPCKWLPFRRETSPFPGQGAAFADNGSIYYFSDGFHSKLYRYNYRSKSRRTQLLDTFRGLITVTPRSYLINSNKLYYLFENQHTPQELYEYDLKSKRQRCLTSLNAKARQSKLGQIAHFRYSSFDRFPIDGVLIFPWSYSPTRTYSLIVDLHGGPTSAFRLEQFLQIHRQRYQQLYASRGYFVFLPNYRGSYQGESTRRLFRKIGIDDIADIESGIAALKRRFHIATNVGVVGHSYGGFLAGLMAHNTTSQNISAVIIRNGMVDLFGTAKQSLVTKLLNTEYLDYRTRTEVRRLKSLSVLRNDQPAKVPVFLIHGSLDKIPVNSVHLLYKKQKTLGAQIEKMIFPDEGHIISKPSNVVAMLNRIQQFFDRYVKSQNEVDSDLKRAEAPYRLTPPGFPNPQNQPSR